MKTKYGEIKSIYDLFERTGEKRLLNPTAYIHCQIIMEQGRCKICGELFEKQSSSGAMMSKAEGWPPTVLGEHIELHETINKIGGSIN